MDKHPAPLAKRLRLENGIRLVDMVAYAAILASGIALVTLPLAQSVTQLADFPGVIAVWATFLLGGGLTGFLGRLTGYWLIENVGVVASGFGAAIYIVVLSMFATSSVTAAFTLGFIAVALVLCIRRWLELQLFGSEPGDFHARLRLAWERRIARFNRTR